MKQELHHDGSDALYETVLKLQSTDECRAFFEDICLSPRAAHHRAALPAAVSAHFRPQLPEIGEITGASSATISRASRQIANSHCGIAEIILRHTKAED